MHGSKFRDLSSHMHCFYLFKMYKTHAKLYTCFIPIKCCLNLWINWPHKLANHEVVESIWSIIVINKNFIQNNLELNMGQSPGLSASPFSRVVHYLPFHFIWYKYKLPFFFYYFFLCICTLPNKTLSNPRFPFFPTLASPTYSTVFPRESDEGETLIFPAIRDSISSQASGEWLISKPSESSSPMR